MADLLNTMNDNGNGAPNGVDQNPTTNGTNEGSPNVDSQEYDFAGVKVQGNDPALATAHKSYVDAQKYIQQLSEENKSLKAKTSSKGVQNIDNIPQKDERLDFIYNRVLENDFEQHKAETYKELETKFGNDFKEIVPMMEKALSNLPLEQKAKINLHNLSKVALGELAYSRLNKSPQEMMQNEQYKQAAMNNPDVRQGVIADTLNTYKGQETLPPNMPNNQGATPLANEGNKPAKTFREAGHRAKLARQQRQQGIRGGQGIR